MGGGATGMIAAPPELARSPRRNQKARHSDDSTQSQGAPKRCVRKRSHARCAVSAVVKR